MPGKHFSIIGILTLCAIIIASLLYLHSNQKFEEVNPAKALPSNSAIVLKVDEPNLLRKSLFTNSDYKEDLLFFENYKYLINLIEFADSSRILNSAFETDLLSRPFQIAFVTDSTSERLWLASAALKTKSEIKNLKKTFENSKIKLINIDNKARQNKNNH